MNVKFVFHSKWECLFYLILLLILIKNQFRGLVIKNLHFLGYLKEVVLSKCFLWVFVFCLTRFDINCLCLSFLQVLVQHGLLFLEFNQGFGDQVCFYFGNNSILLVFRIHFQSKASLLKVYFLFRSHRLWICKLHDLGVILWFLCYQYREGLI